MIEISNRTIARWFLVIFTVVLGAISIYNIVTGDYWLVLFNAASALLCYLFIRSEL